MSVFVYFATSIVAIYTVFCGNFSRIKSDMDLIKSDIDTIIKGVGIPLLDLEGKKLLITGACGFLGSWFIAVIQELNNNHFKSPCRVTAIDSFIATDKKNHIVNIDNLATEFIREDISNRGLIDAMRPLSFDYIIHAAGIASPVYYRKFPIETIDGMVLGLRWLLEYAVEYPVKSFLYFSSSEMYGNPHPDQVPTKEEYYGNVSCIGPRSCYDEAKRLGETYCHFFHRIHGTPVKWVRPFNVYGPGMRIADDRVAPKFIFSALQGKPLTVHVPGVQTRTLCYITDAMIGFFKTLLIGRNGEVYNIGTSNEEITMLELAQKIQSQFGGSPEIQKIEMPTEYPQDQAQRRCPDISKASKELNYHPKVDLDEGLKRMTQWCKSIVK